MTDAEKILEACLKTKYPSKTLYESNLEAYIEQDYSEEASFYYYKDGSFIKDVNGELTAHSS